jgi:hypothetical protein
MGLESSSPAKTRFQDSPTGLPARRKSEPEAFKQHLSLITFPSFSGVFNEKGTGVPPRTKNPVALWSLGVAFYPSLPPPWCG